MKRVSLILLCGIFLVSCEQKKESIDASAKMIVKGQMPAIAKDREGNIYIVYGSGDSLMYTFSKNKASSFAAPQLIDILPGLVAGATRGPQVAATAKGLVAIALTKTGNIFSYAEELSGQWIKTAKVNDADTTNKEGFLGISSDGKNKIFAIWPDLRNDKRNKIYGSGSADGGKTWSKNVLVYASPDGTICECCKPSIAMQNDKVVVMFRNWLNGNRDLYIVQSADAGGSFGQAQKLGKGSWALNGCPMDGGGLAINQSGNIETVWRRESKIYASEPGKEEKQIGEGRSCNIEATGKGNVYTWSENGDIICKLPDGSKKTIGKGSLPLLKSISQSEVICVWENNNMQIESYVFHL